MKRLWNFYPLRKGSKDKEPWMDNPHRIGRKITRPIYLGKLWKSGGGVISKGRLIRSIKTRRKHVMKKRIHTIKRSVRSIVHRIKRSVRKHNPGLGLGVFGLGNPHPSTKGLGHRMRLVGFRKGSTVRLSPFSLTARRMKGRVINPLETRTYHKGTHPKRSKSMKHRRSHRKYRRSNPFLPKNILPKNVFGKQMLGEVVGGTVGFFAVEKVPGLLPAAWGATGNTWQAWVSMVLTLLAGNFIIGNVLKKQDMAKSFFVGGTLAIVVKALKTNIPQLAGTGYFIPQRTLAGGVGRTMAPGTSAAQTLLTRTTHEQARHS